MSFGQFFWGGPHAGEKIKKHPLGGIPGGGIVALDGPGCGWLMAAKLFEIEMYIYKLYITCMVKKPQLCL